MKRSNNFAAKTGIVYFFAVAFFFANIWLTDVSNTKYICFFPTTIYPVLALIVGGLLCVAIPVGFIIYVVLFLKDLEDLFNKPAQISECETTKTKARYFVNIIYTLSSIFFLLVTIFALSFFIKNQNIWY